MLNNPLRNVDPSGHCSGEQTVYKPECTGQTYVRVYEPLDPPEESPIGGTAGGKGIGGSAGGTSGGHNWVGENPGGNGNNIVPRDVHAFGGNDQIGRPRPPRSGYDIPVDETGMVPAQQPPNANGASTYGDPIAGGLTGSYHRLRAGTKLPPGLGIVADGQDVNPQSPHAPTHHTIYPTEGMTYDRFTGLYQGLGWEYNAGKIGKPK